MILAALMIGCCCLPGTGSARIEQGLASYYGDEFQCKKTASGELYDREALTCAHRTLPFGTRVRVVNLKNKKKVLVRVNDRGPWVAGRIIDLSYAAAQKLDMIRDGVVKVKITPLK